MNTHTHSSIGHETLRIPSWPVHARVGDVVAVGDVARAEVVNTSVVNGVRSVELNPVNVSVDVLLAALVAVPVDVKVNNDVVMTVVEARVVDDPRVDDDVVAVEGVVPVVVVVEVKAVSGVTSTAVNSKGGLPSEVVSRLA